MRHFRKFVLMMVSSNKLKKISLPNSVVFDVQDVAIAIC